MISTNPENWSGDTLSVKSPGGFRIGSTLRLAAGSPPDLHLRPGDGDPLVLGRVEPREAEVVAAVEVRVLTVREPPAALVVGGAVRVADVTIHVDRAELHPVLVIEGVAGVPAVAVHVQAEAVLRARHAELVVLGHPCLSVDVPEVHAQGRAVVSGETVQSLIAKPELPCKQEE